MSHSNLEVAIPFMWCCLEMAGPESQSSSAGAAIKGFDKV